MWKLSQCGMRFKFWYPPIHIHVISLENSVFQNLLHGHKRPGGLQQWSWGKRVSSRYGTDHIGGGTIGRDGQDPCNRKGPDLVFINSVLRSTWSWFVSSMSRAVLSVCRPDEYVYHASAIYIIYKIVCCKWHGSCAFKKIILVTTNITVRITFESLQNIINDLDLLQGIVKYIVIVRLLY
jgi:hypothetical protein